MLWSRLVVWINLCQVWIRGMFRYPERFFLVISFITGIGFLVLIPPFQNPDEQVHFYRAYQISTLQLSAESKNFDEGTELGGHLPSSLKQTYNINNTGRYGAELGTNSADRFRLGALKESLKVQLDKENVEWHGFSSSAIYSPISYLPQSIGIGIGSLFNLPPILLLYLGRLFGLIFFIGCIYQVIKTLPTKKWAFATLFTLPVIVSQSTAITADTVTTVSIGISIALILCARVTERLNRRQLILLALSVVATTLSKQVFLLVIPLLFMLPGKIFNSKYNKYIFIAVVGLMSILAYLAWSTLGNVSEGMSLTVNSSHGADISGQINYLIHNILKIPLIFYNTFLTAEYGSGIYWSLAGNFGWLSAPLAFPGMLLTYLLIVSLFFSGYTKTEVKGWKSFNSMLIMVAILLFGAIGGSLYIAYTSVGGAAIAGLQGRYYVPILIILLAVINPYTVIIKKSQYIKILTSLSIVVLSISLITVIMRYWVVSTLW